MTASRNLCVDLATSRVALTFVPVLRCVADMCQRRVRLRYEWHLHKRDPNADGVIISLDRREATALSSDRSMKSQQEHGSRAYAGGSGRARDFIPRQNSYDSV